MKGVVLILHDGQQFIQFPPVPGSDVPSFCPMMLPALRISLSILQASLELMPPHLPADNSKNKNDGTCNHNLEKDLKHLATDAEGSELPEKIHSAHLLLTDSIGVSAPVLIIDSFHLKKKGPQV